MKFGAKGQWPIFHGKFDVHMAARRCLEGNAVAPARQILPAKEALH